MPASTYPKYHLVETMRQLTGVHWEVLVWTLRRPKLRPALVPEELGPGMGRLSGGLPRATDLSDEDWIAAFLLLSAEQHQVLVQVIHLRQTLLAHCCSNPTWIRPSSDSRCLNLAPSAEHSFVLPPEPVRIPLQKRAPRQQAVVCQVPAPRSAQGILRASKLRRPRPR